MRLLLLGEQKWKLFARLLEAACEIIASSWKINFGANEASWSLGAGLCWREVGNCRTGEIVL